MHRLLRRQVKRYLDSYLNGEAGVSEALESFLHAIDEAYGQFDGDRAMLERSIELTSQELLQVNAQLRAVIPDSFLRLDLSGTILDYKVGSTGDTYIPDGDPIGKTIQSYLPEDVADRLQTAMWQVRARHQVVELEHVLSRYGEDYYYEVRLLGLLDNQVVAIVRDITDRKRTEAALRDSERRSRQQAAELQATLEALKTTQAKLIQSEKMSSLGQLVAGIAHEVNNPVNFIFGNLTHLEEYVGDLMAVIDAYRTSYPDPSPAVCEEMDRVDLEFVLEDLKKLGKSMRLGVERIQQTVLALRNFSRLDEADLKPVNLHEGLDSTLAILNHRLVRRNGDPIVRVERQYGKLPPVNCYPSLLNQVVMNLAANAIDALETRDRQRSAADIARDPSRLTLATALGSQPGWVALRVSDNGPGIDRAVQARMFDPFFTTKPVGRGTGLGLAISHQIVVEKHGGTLTCESELGRGTTFTLEIPVGGPGGDRAAAAKDSTPPLSPDRSPIATSERSTARLPAGEERGRVGGGP